MSGLLGDLRYAARMLVKHPAVSGLAVVTLGLGIGLTAVMFSIVYGALWRGLPFDNGDRILAVQRANPERGFDQMGVPIHEYRDWREQQTSFEQLAALYEGTVNVRWLDEPERFDGAFVTANLFSALGVQPQIGRPVREDEDDPGAPATVILSDQVWADRFDRDPTILGQVVKVNGEPSEVIGVMPEGFEFPSTQRIWVPLRVDPAELARDGGTWLNVLGRLRDNVSLDAAMVEFTGIMARLASEYPDTNEGIVPVIQPYTEQYLGPEAKTLLLTMLGVVSLVLLIACANVANLLLARAAQRTREVGIRTALGANRYRVIGQMVTEALALAGVGALLGSAVAWIGIQLFVKAIEPTDPPFFLVFALDGPILLFITAAAAFSALIAGGIPAIKASGLDISNVLKDESRGSSSLQVGRLSKVLVVGEIAMSVSLLVAAGLMTKSIATLSNFDFGFETETVFTARLGLFESEFPDTLSRRAFYRELEGRVREIPGVRYAALGTVLPGMGSNRGNVALEGATYSEDRDFPSARWGQVSPGYFATVRAEMLQGRDFSGLDNAEALPVAIVNRSFAEKHFRTESALGRRFRPRLSNSTEPWLTIVGVVSDLRMEGVGNSDSDTDGYYVPIEQSDGRFMSILARGPSEPMSLTEAVRSAVTSVHPDTPMYFVEPLEARIAEQTWIYTVFGSLFMVFGAVALFLASVGLYGVMAFSVTRRTPEVGIRMALGASQGNVLKMVLGQGIRQIAVGLAFGLGLAILVARGLRIVLFEVDPNDPFVFLAISTVLALTGLLATYVPARRATRADPAIALRYD